MPTRQVAQINTIRTNCPGPTCELLTTVCTTTPIILSGNTVDFNLAKIMMDKQSSATGSGAQARVGDGANIRGPLINFPNPFGNVEGIVCGTSVVDVAMYGRFVQIADTRDPNLQGNLTVAGAVTVGGPTNLNNALTVTGPTILNNTVAINGAATVGPCINLAGGATGRAGFGCANPNDLPAGFAGGVRSPDVVANANILTSNNPAGFTGSNTNYALLTADNGTGVAEIRTSGRAAGDRLTPLGSYGLGTACTPADAGSIAKVLGGSGLVTCTGSMWRALSLSAATGDVCTPEGSKATTAGGVELLCVNGGYRALSEIIRSGSPGAACTTPGTLGYDTANLNEALICRSNINGGALKWMRMRDVTTQIVLADSFSATNNQIIVKPSCLASGSSPATPLLQLIPKNTATPDGGTAIYATDNGISWTVQLKNGVGGELTDTSGAGANVVAQVYCYFS